ncbi:metalloendoproteinase 2-MMP-like [Impatiens glandulifera]|uniref:metalloendoproteinase 2-MMP-like n=1 Tax=Impatiens glandulifera TaxID=253017 RepID=UPI001FB0D17D|nr:metalloendoproteinase 2-MMP-like [Impatiens glandulifera]
MKKTHLFTALILSSFLFNFSSYAIPHFFPNASAIPPYLLPNVTGGAWDGFQNLLGCRPGQKVDGLGKLKKYFQYFGYINSSSANATDDFDDYLESAIKTYQLNFNLNPTGELDNPTLKQLMMPRCGIADIINGSSTMNSGKNPPASANLHIHNVAHYTFFPGSPRWPANRRDLTYAFHPDNQVPQNAKAVFASAFQRWAAVIPMTFVETSSFQAADIRIAFASGEHGDGEPFDGVLGTLAHAFSPTSGMLHLDADETWVIDGDFSTSSSIFAVDLESVVIHEIGHLLGLGHSSVVDAMMYPSIASRTRKLNLAGDDIEGIQVLYGANPNFNGSSTTPTPTGQRETSPNGGVHIGVTYSSQFLLAAAFTLLLSLL